MNSGWREYRFAEMLIDGSISYGIVQPGSHTERDSVPIIRVNNIKNGNIKTDDVLMVASLIEKKYQRTRLSGGELLITVVGSIGECAIVPAALAGWNVARAVSVARIKESFDKRFIKYAFKTEEVIFQMYGNTNDTVQPTLNLSSIKEIKFLLPPLPEQKAIAGVLSSLDDKIDLLHRQNKTLEGMAEALWRQMFVEEADPGWQRGKLGDLVELCYGKGLKEEKRTLGVYPVLGSNGVVGYHNEFLVEGPGIVIGRKGTLGVVNYVEDNFFPIDTTFYIKNKTNTGKLFFEYFLLKEFAFEDMNSDSAVPGLNREIAESMELLIPKQKLIMAFNEFCEPLFTKKMKNHRQMRTLSRLRDTLLPKLMNGEVRVELEELKT